MANTAGWAMQDDLRVGNAVRALRRRNGWRLQRLAAASGVSVSTISRLERGGLDGMSLRAVRRICAGVGLRVSLRAWLPGGELDSLLDRAHAQLGEAVADWLIRHGWTLRPEVSFSRWGERGSIDILAWHPGESALLVIELKTAITDLQDLLSTMDRKLRLAPGIGGELGWPPDVVGAAVLVSDTRTNRRRVQQHARLLRAAFPSDGRGLRGWLLRPVRPMRALAFWPDSHHAATRADAGRSRGA
jgi:transcriptional regulator with XRE-family HTH domain